MSRQSWTKNALCAGLPVKWWYPKKGNSIESVVKTSIACTICSLCSEVKNCAARFETLSTQEKVGIWAGTNKKTKKKIARNETTLEAEFKKNQQRHISPTMQNRLIYSSCADKQILTINSWLLSEIKAKRTIVAPKRTEEQIYEALVEAGRCRSVRKEIKLQLNMGEISLFKVFEIADSEKAIAGLKIIDVIKSFPGIGEGTATQILIEGNVSLRRRIKGLGYKQREYLLAHPRLK